MQIDYYNLGKSVWKWLVLAAEYEHRLNQLTSLQVLPYYMHAYGYLAFVSL